MAKKAATKPTSQRREGYLPKITPKAISRTRADMSTWKAALRSADSIDEPRRARLINLYNDISIDAHLTAQIELRRNSLLATPFHLEISGKVSETVTISKQLVAQITRHIFDSTLMGHSLVELTYNHSNELTARLLPRTNVIPEKGTLLLSETDSQGVHYRQTREYGSWLIEFGNNNDYGLLNKAVPHVLFKRFAQACWSELCEIYGIPPRYVKTDTADPEMLDRAESMMRDMGSAAWFVIDTTEEFAFAKGADTNGDVYRNLIALSNSELSLLFNGAVMGQDTVNGNRSKEESSLKLFEKLLAADREMAAMMWNSIVIPALVKIGQLPEGALFCYEKEEDIEKLWSMVKELLPYKEVPNDYILKKFGIECGDKKQPTAENLAASFFV